VRAETERLLRDLTGKARLGLVTRADMLAVSAPRSWLRSQLKTGTLRQMEADVFALSGSWDGAQPPWGVEALAACLQRGPEARLGFASAARIWGLADGQSAPGDRFHVLVPLSRAFRTTYRVQVHRTRRLTARDVTSFAELPVTTVARTLIDLAASMTAASVEVVVDDALVRGLTTVPLLSGALNRNAHQGCSGAPLVREALSLWGVGPVESHAEAEVLRWLLSVGVPEPVRQLAVAGADGRRFRVDLAWPQSRVALEVDGYAHHHGPRKLSADHERRSVLASLGWNVLTTTSAEVRRGGSSLLAALRTLGVLGVAGVGAGEAAGAGSRAGRRPPQAARRRAALPSGPRAGVGRS